VLRFCEGPKPSLIESNQATPSFCVTSGRRGGHDFWRTETKVVRGINAFAEGVADNPTAIFVIKRNTDCGDCVVRLADTPNVEPEELPSAVYSTKKELEKNLRIGDPDSDKKSLECVCVIAVIQGGLE